MFFEWDEEKARTNLQKHGVSFDEAQTVFRDTLAGIRDDPDHSFWERREIITGYSVKQRLLLVSFTQRGKVIRLINARPATRTERRAHEEENRS